MEGNLAAITYVVIITSCSLVTLFAQMLHHWPCWKWQKLSRCSHKARRVNISAASAFSSLYNQIQTLQRYFETFAICLTQLPNWLFYVISQTNPQIWWRWCVTTMFQLACLKTRSLGWQNISSESRNRTKSGIKYGKGRRLLRIWTTITNIQKWFTWWDQTTNFFNFTI